jgi:hypothetical protein
MISKFQEKMKYSYKCSAVGFVSVSLDSADRSASLSSFAVTSFRVWPH